MRIATWVCCVLAVSWGGAACGGSTSGAATDGGTPGTGGANGTSGAGGTASACAPLLESCPALPASQGSASIHVQGPSMEAVAAGKQCAPGVHFADAPSAFTSDERTTGSTRPHDTIVDGESSAQFACSVVPSGDKFAVSGQINIPAFDKDNHPLSIPTQIRVSTTLGKDDTGAPGALSVSDSSTAGISYQANECTFTVKPDVQDPKLGIGPGKAWGRVICPNLADLQDPSSSCSVDVGYFILENCREY